VKEIEKQFLTALVNERRRPSVTGSTWDEHGHTMQNTPAEASRLLESADYVKGWEACHRSFHEALALFVRGELTLADIKRYVAHSKRQTEKK
jgi:hypothetical protein